MGRFVATAAARQLIRAIIQQEAAGCCFEVFVAGLVERLFDANLWSGQLILLLGELGYEGGDRLPFERAFKPSSDPRVVTLEVPSKVQVLTSQFVVRLSSSS